MRQREAEPTYADGTPAERAVRQLEPGEACAVRGGAGRAPQAVGGLLYVMMTALGAATLFLACRDPIWRWAAAAVYCVYAPAAGMLFAVRGCGHSLGRSEPGGAVDDGRALASAAAEERARAFRAQLPLLVPAWFLPPVATVLALVLRFSWPVLAVGLFFGVVAVVLLPLAARYYICPRCPLQGTCPWMGRQGGPDR